MSDKILDEAFPYMNPFEISVNIDEEDAANLTIKFDKERKDKRLFRMGSIISREISQIRSIINYRYKDKNKFKADVKNTLSLNCMPLAIEMLDVTLKTDLPISIKKKYFAKENKKIKQRYKELIPGHEVKYRKYFLFSEDLKEALKNSNLKEVDFFSIVFFILLNEFISLSEDNASNKNITDNLYN